MICKSCGTECSSEICTHCGAKLVNDAFAPEHEEIPTAPAQSQTTQPSPAADSDSKTAETHDQEDKTPTQKAKVRQRKKEEYVPDEHLGEKIYISFESIFFPTLFLLLPICYLFFDLFAVYSGNTFAQGEGGSALFLLVSMLFSGAHIGTPATSLINATVGDGFVSTVTLTSILESSTASTALVAGAVTILIIAVLCAVAAVMLFVTWGRLLRHKIFADFVVSVSVLGALAPLVAYLIMRLFSDSGDATMQYLHFSLETVLLFAISLCLMIPAAKKLRRVAGGVRVGVFATLPYRLASRNTLVSRILAISFGVLGMVMPFLIVFAGGVSREGIEMTDSFAVLTATIGNIGTVFSTIGTLFSGGDTFEVMGAFADLFFVLMIGFMCLYTVFALVSMIKLIITGKQALLTKKRARRSFDRMAGRFRGAAVAAVAVPMALHVLLTLVALFLTNAFQYIDVFNVGETLNVIYALMAYTGTCFELNAFGWGLAVLSVLCATVGGNFARGIANRAGELGE